MIGNILDLEKPITELENKISELKKFTAEQGIDKSEEIAQLEQYRVELLQKIFSNLSPWDNTMLARHPERPYTLDYVRMIFEEFTELHGDRRGGDDHAIVSGLAKFNGDWVLVVGHQKGRDIRERALRNFGSARPEGFRKAIRLMEFAEKFNRPIFCFVDTPAADCTVNSEQHGISEAIAYNLMRMSTLKVPVIVSVIGEGGSGGALGIGVGDRILMLEHSIYSVIPPEGCAAILWHDNTKAAEAAEALKPTAEGALSFGLIDEVVPEPLGGAHRNPEKTAANLKEALIRNLEEIKQIPTEKLLQNRYAKFRKMGVFAEE